MSGDMPQLKLVLGETRMFTRFQRYIDNVGLHWFLANLVLLGYLMYVHISIAMSSAGGAILEVVIVLPIALIGLVGPWLILGFLVARPNGSLRVARLCSYAIFVWIALQIFAKVTLPLYVFPLIMLAVFLSFGITYWVISDPRLLTDRGLQRQYKRYDTSSDS